MKLRLNLLICFLYLYVFTLIQSSRAINKPDKHEETPSIYTTTYVESMPTHMEDLNQSVSLHTHEAILGLIQNATTSIDMTVMYWSLLPQSCGWNNSTTTTSTTTQSPSNPNSPSESEDVPDCEGFTSEEMESFLAYRGRLIYDALIQALTRGVRI